MLEDLANISTLLGFPSVVLAFLIDARVRSTAVDRETHLEMTRRYSEFLRMCMEGSDLNLSDTIVGHEVAEEKLEAGSKKLVAMQILVSLFEDAFYLYHGSSKRLRQVEWGGWEKYIQYWMSRSDFRGAWKEHLSSQYNTEFMAFMECAYTRSHLANVMIGEASAVSRAN